MLTAPIRSSQEKAAQMVAVATALALAAHVSAAMVGAAKHVMSLHATAIVTLEGFA